MTDLYVDLSSNNGTPDLVAYRDAGHTRLTLKATEGTGYFWPQMAALARQWHAFGPEYRIRFYHWLYGTISAAAQWSFFWSHVAGVFRSGDDVMCDFEDVAPARWVSDAQHQAVLQGFLQLAGTKAPPNTYTGNWYLVNLPSTVVYLRAVDVTLSDYSNDPPSNPHGLRVTDHQFTDRATVPGIPTPVDYNRSMLEAPSGGGTPIPVPVIGDGDLSAEEVNHIIGELKDYIDLKLNGTLARVAEDDPVIVTLHTFIRDTALAIGGQNAALPGGSGSLFSLSSQRSRRPWPSSA